MLSLGRYAASVDDILEEEEHYADQLKEYLFYTEALRYCTHSKNSYMFKLIHLLFCSSLEPNQFNIKYFISC